MPWNLIAAGAVAFAILYTVWVASDFIFDDD